MHRASCAPGFHVILGFVDKGYRISWDAPPDWRIVNRLSPPKGPELVAAVLGSLSFLFLHGSTRALPL